MKKIIRIYMPTFFWIMMLCLSVRLFLNSSYYIQLYAPTAYPLDATIHFGTGWRVSTFAVCAFIGGGGVLWIIWNIIQNYI